MVFIFLYANLKSLFKQNFRRKYILYAPVKSVTFIQDLDEKMFLNFITQELNTKIACYYKMYIFILVVPIQNNDHA